MTEAEWQGCTDPLAMLDCVRGRVTERLARLLVCACCRLCWRSLKDARSREAVAAAERYADGHIGHEELAAAGQEAERVRRPTKAARAAAAVATGEVVVYWLSPPPDEAGPPSESRMWSAWAGDVLAEMSGGRDARPVAGVLRDLFSNPFRPVAVDPAWRTPAALSLAQAAYQERELPSGRLDPARLLVLADALEEAGCQSGEILGHLRAPGPHVRGCWALDLILGKGDGHDRGGVGRLAEAVTVSVTRRGGTQGA